jgi:hypothetical protein
MAISDCGSTLGDKVELRLFFLDQRLACLAQLSWRSQDPPAVKPPSIAIT